MKTRLTIGIGVLSIFAFFVTFLLGAGISSVSQSFWKDAVPFLGIMLALMFVFSGKSCCRSKRGC